jgi:hypothetical protein
MNYQFSGGINITIKIPKSKYESTDLLPGHIEAGGRRKKDHQSNCIQNTE